MSMVGSGYCYTDHTQNGHSCHVDLVTKKTTLKVFVHQLTHNLIQLFFKLVNTNDLLNSFWSISNTS